MTIGRPKGGNLSEEQKIISALTVKEYQKKYRETHKSKKVILKKLIDDISKIKINVNNKT